MSTRRVSYGLAKPLADGKEDVFLQTLINLLPLPAPAINSRKGNYTLQASDSGSVLVMTNQLAATVLVDINSNLPIGSRVPIIRVGPGVLSILAGSGITLHSVDNLYNVAFQYGEVILTRISETAYVLTGSLGEAPLVNELGQIITTEDGAPIIP